MTTQTGHQQSHLPKPKRVNTMNSINKTARLAGLLYLVLALLSAFGLTYVPATLIVPGDVVTTAQNIVASASLFRLGFMSNLMTFTVNIFVALLLYKVLKTVNKNAASLMVVLILLGLGIAMLNELNQVVALLLLRSDYLTAFTPVQLQSLASLFLDIYQHGFSIAHIFWGLWLFPMGYLVFKSGFLPKVIGILLIIAGLGYLVDFTLFFLAPDVTLKASYFTFVGEVALLFWLLVKGINVEKWQKHTLASMQ
jgi:Domain of unknown function (DUF4386)